MSRSAARVLLVIGLALLGSGLLVGVLPIKGHGVTCGGGFWSSDSASVSDLTSSFSGEDGGAGDACADRRSTLRIVSTPLLLSGALLGAAGWLSVPPRRLRQA